ncbi:MAG: NPCBM/NEW2 domain-containing protein, partial [Firmicutes bacterium]|nr:NPCBM/NEW2 domain-containing protein [Bacillota bacterium]
KQRLQGLIAGIAIGAICASGIAYAKSATQTIEVTYDNIKVYKDNVLCDLKDANGNTIEPFIYNGTTYMPVRGVASAVGMDVTWDGTNKGVYLWDEQVASNTYLMDVCPPYENSINYKEYLPTSGNSFSMAGEKYSNGFTLTAIADCYALFNLNGKYSSIELTVGCADSNSSDATGTVSFIVDGELIKTVDIDTEMLPQKISIPLNYGLQMKVVATGGSTWHCLGVGLANIIVK